MRARLSSALISAFVLTIFAASSLLAYSVKLKDGSIIFARAKYEVKGKKAIITLQNGTVVSYDLEQIDVPGTEKYNQDIPGNAVALETGDSKAVIVPTQPALPTLQELMKKRQVKFQAPASKTDQILQATSSMLVDASVEQAFRKVLDGAGIAQYRISNVRGKVRFLATANTEEAVFNTLSAVARALAELGGRGQSLAVDIVLTTSSGDSGGNFDMNSDQARLIVNGNLPIAEYFLKNVIL